jgi:hypothetical protein
LGWHSLSRRVTAVIAVHAELAPPVTARWPQVLPHAVTLNRRVVIRISLMGCMVVSKDRGTREAYWMVIVSPGTDP